jgi:hypothetical protein
MRVTAYGEALRDSRLMADFLLYADKYGLSPAEKEREIESRYLAWDISGQRASLLCGKEVGEALSENRKAVFDYAEAMRAHQYATLNDLRDVSNQTHFRLVDAMRQELDLPWDERQPRRARHRDESHLQP